MATAAKKTAARKTTARKTASTPPAETVSEGVVVQYRPKDSEDGWAVFATSGGSEKAARSQIGQIREDNPGHIFRLVRIKTTVEPLED